MHGWELAELRRTWERLTRQVEKGLIALGIVAAPPPRPRPHLRLVWSQPRGVSPPPAPPAAVPPVQAVPRR